MERKRSTALEHFGDAFEGEKFDSMPHALGPCLKRLKLGKTELPIVTVLCGICKPGSTLVTASYDTLADRTASHVDTVARDLAKLETRGLVTQVRQGGGGRRTSHWDISPLKAALAKALEEIRAERAEREGEAPPRAHGPVETAAHPQVAPEPQEPCDEPVDEAEAEAAEGEGDGQAAPDAERSRAEAMAAEESRQVAIEAQRQARALAQAAQDAAEAKKVQEATEATAAVDAAWGRLEKGELTDAIVETLLPALRAVLDRYGKSRLEELAKLVVSNNITPEFTVRIPDSVPQVQALAVIERVLARELLRRDPTRGALNFNDSGLVRILFGVGTEIPGPSGQDDDWVKIEVTGINAFQVAIDALAAGVAEPAEPEPAQRPRRERTDKEKLVMRTAAFMSVVSDDVNFVPCEANDLTPDEATAIMALDEETVRTLCRYIEAGQLGTKVELKTLLPDLASVAAAAVEWASEAEEAA